MIEALLVALVLIAIVCIIGGVVVKVVPWPHPLVPTVIWAVIAVVCLLILLDVVRRVDWQVSLPIAPSELHVV